MEREDEEEGDKQRGVLDFFTVLFNHNSKGRRRTKLCVLIFLLRDRPLNLSASHVSAIGSRAVIVTIELPRMTWRSFFCFFEKRRERRSEFFFRRRGRGRGRKRRKKNKTKDPSSSAHHHPDVLLHLVVHGAVEHDVHELVEAAQRARDGAVGVEGDCGCFFVCFEYLKEEEEVEFFFFFDFFFGRLIDACFFEVSQSLLD